MKSIKTGTMLILVSSINFLLYCKGPQWREFTSREAGFSILMPAEVTKQEHVPLMEESGLEFWVFISSYPPGDFMVSRTRMSRLEGVELTADEIDELLEETKQGNLESVSSSQLVYEKPINRQGFGGIEFKATGKHADSEVEFTTRIFVIDENIYQIGVVVEGGTIPGWWIEKYMESFKLIDR